MLHLLRHGRTAHNAGGRLLGRSDVPLDAVGERQARAAAAALTSAELVVCSPMARTRATAAAVVERSGADLVVDERWIELDYGELEGTPLPEVPAATWAAWRSDPAFTPPGGESLVALGERVRRACAELAETAATAEVVVVSHVSPIKASVCWALGAGEELAWSLFVAPGSISRVHPGGDRPVLHSFNETAHLPSGGR